MDRDELSSLYREPPIDVSYQASVHLAKRFQRRRFFRNHPIRNKNCLWWPYLLADLDEMSNHNRGLSIDTSYQDRDELSSLYREPPIDVSYQVSVHLAKRFQRRRFLEIDQSKRRIACGSHVC